MEFRFCEVKKVTYIAAPRRTAEKTYSHEDILNHFLRMYHHLSFLRCSIDILPSRQFFQPLYFGTGRLRSRDSIKVIIELILAATPLADLLSSDSTRAQINRIVDTVLIIIRVLCCQYTRPSPNLDQALLFQSIQFYSYRQHR